MTTNIKDEVWVERREDWKAGTADARDAAATDYARIVHSSSFRRLPASPTEKMATDFAVVGLGRGCNASAYFLSEHRGRCALD